MKIKIDEEYFLNEMWETMHKLDDGEIDVKRVNKKIREFDKKLKVLKKGGIQIDD